MSTKTFCDRCGKEIKPRKLFRPNGKPYDVALEYVFQRYGYGRKSWELCYDCAKAVRAFLNSPDPGDVYNETEVKGDEDWDDDEEEYI